MENLTPKQQKNILKIAKFLDNKESALVESFIELDDKLEMLDEKIETVTENLKKKLEEELLYEVDEQKIADNVLSKITVPKNGEDYVLTEDDKQDIASKIVVPVVVKEVETIVEKVEVIRETPIVTENVVEKAVTDTADVIIEKINKSEGKINVERIEGSFVSQETYTDEIKTLQNRTQLLAQIASSARDRVIPSGGGTPGGSNTQVQFNDSGVFGGDAGLTFNKTTNMLSAGGLTATGGAVLEKVVTLTDGATVALDASLGNVFNLTAGGDRTILAPTNPTDGQKIRIKILASGADRTITMTTGANAFVFSTYVMSPLPAILSGKVMALVCDYSSLNSLWTILAENTGV